MGDHFVLLVDRLVTESTLEAAIESRKLLQIGQGATLASMEDVIEIPFRKRNFIDGSLSSRKLVEYRICQDEDEDSSMEVPCSCSGSLKLGQIAHGVDFKAFKSTAKIVLKEHQTVSSDSFEVAGCLLYQRIGVVSGKAIFGPPLEEYWTKKLQEEASKKKDEGSS